MLSQLTAWSDRYLCNSYGSNNCSMCNNVKGSTLVTNPESISTTLQFLQFFFNLFKPLFFSCYIKYVFSVKQPTQKYVYQDMEETKTEQKKGEYQTSEGFFSDLKAFECRPENL